MFARTPRYAPAPPGIRSESRILAAGQNGSTVRAGWGLSLQVLFYVSVLSPCWLAREIGELAGLIAAGELELPIEATFPLDRVGDAYRRLEEGHVLGKIVLLP